MCDCPEVVTGVVEVQYALMLTFGFCRPNRDMKELQHFDLSVARWVLIPIHHAGQKLVAEHLRSYDHRRDFENPEHVRELLNQRRGAQEHKRLQRFLALSPKAETFCRQMEARHLNAKQQVQQIVALSEIYPPEAVARALEDATDLCAFRAEYIANILAMRARRLPEPGALYVTRRQDLLELDLPEPDLDPRQYGLG